MPQPNLIRFRCSNCKRVNYYAHKNIRRIEKKLEPKKHCPWCKKHTVHKEIKK